MTGSNYKTYLDPQIDARNRFINKNAAAYDLPPRPRRFSASAFTVRVQSTRREVVAAVGLLVTAALAVFVVLVLQAGPASSQPTPSTGTISVTNGHGGGGLHFRVE